MIGWRYKLDGVASDPVPLIIIHRAIENGLITSKTPVWSPRSTAWRSAEEHFECIDGKPVLPIVLIPLSGRQSITNPDWKPPVTVFPATLFTTLRRTFYYKGRASRAELGHFILLCIVGWLITYLVFNSLHSPGLTMLDRMQRENLAEWTVLYSILVPFLPGASLTVRRLHDTGRGAKAFYLPFIFHAVILLWFISIEKGWENFAEALAAFAILALGILIHGVTLLILGALPGDDAPNQFDK